MKRQRSFLTALTLSVFWAFGYGGASARDIVVHAGKLIDGASKTVQSNVSIFIHDDRISGIQPGFATPKGFTVVDLSKSTVLPGLIDCHDHITNQFDGGNPVAEAVTETDYDDAVKSTAYARTTLLAGFTSIRDVGAVTGVVVALKRAIAKGIVDGPRMWVAGTPLGPTDGHNAIDAAVLLGVDSIEHGSFADAGSYQLMKQHGTYLVPTLLVAQTVYDIARTHPEQLNPSSAAKALLVAPRIQKNLHDAYVAGVKIAFGTDQGLAPHGTNAKEFALMVKAGMTPMDAIMAATGSGADLIGDTNDIGSVQKGRYADLVAVNGDPIADITQLQHIAFVMKGGTVYKANGQPLAR